MRRYFRLGMIAIWIGLLLGLYGYTIVRRAQPVREFLADPYVCWRDELFMADPALGYRLRPNMSTARVYRSGDAVPAFTDSSGFRVSNTRIEPQENTPNILTLGGSYTFGAGVLAEQTFASLVGDALGARTLNAGIGGQGLAQMILLAEQIIPDSRPICVLAQYAPWTVDRAQTLIAPSYFGSVPTPYIARGKDNRLYLAPPAFSTNVFRLPTRQFLGRDDGGFSFVANIGVPLIVDEDRSRVTLAARRVLDRLPEPCQDDAEVAGYGYARLQKACERSGAALYVVVLATDAATSVEPIASLGIPLIRADHALEVALNGRSYAEAYHQDHGRGVTDSHPNAEAHRVIADEILRVLSAPH